jgi:hypothetical protein
VALPPCSPLVFVSHKSPLPTNTGGSVADQVRGVEKRTG